MKRPTRKHLSTLWPLWLAGILLIIGLFVMPSLAATRFVRDTGEEGSDSKKEETKEEEVPPLDTALFDRKLAELANYPSTTPTTTPRIWPVETVYPLPGAILPFHRIVAYYGNFYSTRMGILGEFDPPVVLDRLRQEVARWEQADPGTPVVPAIDYIATTAQGSPGQDGYYRFRMPDEHVEKAFAMADQIDGIVILEIQAGLAPLHGEIEAFEQYLKRPNGHLAIDPEFNMKGGEPPGTVIGTVSAGDINRATAYLAELVRANNLPPKVLIVHRFTQRMVTDYQLIETRPEVQVVIVMDGWGPPAKKINTYKSFIAPEPVQFTGFKIFYKNDLKPPSERLLTPGDLLKLTPRPSFIQYQ